MSKNIILLSDGTGKSNVIKRGTNVFKLYEAIDFNLPDCQQVAFYDDGVGSQEFKPLKILGGVFGWGLSRNIRQLYKDLVQTYAPGDKIYLFGFSRGAFTVRTLAGFIAQMGILDAAAYPDDQQLDRAVWHCYQHYRSRNLAVFERHLHLPRVNELTFCETEPSIEFIGVWDTVDAVGLPFEEAADFLNHYLFRFKFEDHKLHERVKKASQAIAVDEQRQTFKPLLWADDPRIEQVWFPGVHGDVGGGYPQQGLALVVLEWMMAKAQAAGLKFTALDVEFVKDRQYVFDKLHNSRAGMNVYYRYLPRNIMQKSAENAVVTPKIHVSVFERIVQGVFGYAPGNLPTVFEIVDNQGTHSNSEAIVRTVNQAVAKITPAVPVLLDQAAHLISLRRRLYSLFLGYSFFTLFWLVRGDLADPTIGLFGTLKILVSPDGLLDKLAVLFWDYPVFVLVGVIIFVASVYVRQKIEGVFAEFWSKLRPALGALLK